MGLIDSILNLAGVLLWLSWRSIRFDPLVKTSPATLVGTLRRAEPRRLKGWQFLAGLARCCSFCVPCSIGRLARRRTGRPSSTSILLSWPSAATCFFPTMFFSVLSFARVLIVCYFWLLVVAMINRRNTAPDPLLKMLRLHLGPVARWPWLVQLLLPLLLIAGLWVALHPLLVHLEIASRVRLQCASGGTGPPHRNGALPQPAICAPGVPFPAPDRQLRVFGDQSAVGFCRRDRPQSSGAASPVAAADCPVRFCPSGRGHSDLLPAALVAQLYSGHNGSEQREPLAAVARPPRRPQLAATFGSFTATVVAAPRSLWIDSVPPCNSVRRRAMTSPKPSPCCSWILRSNCM